MAISKEKFLRLFLDEFKENLLSAENQIVLLKADQGNVDALATLLRTLHTIKGSSRMMQFAGMEQVVHGAETVFKGVRDGRYAVDVRLTRFFFLIADRLRYAARAVGRGEPDEIPDRELVLAACEKISANEAFDLSSIPVLATEDSVVGSEGGNTEEDATGSDGDENQKPPRGGDLSDHFETSIRVDSETIDRSINLVNTLTIRQLRLKSASEQLDGLEKRLTQSYRTIQDIKVLRKELANLTRAIRLYRSQYDEQLFEIEHGTLELRDTVIGMRMLPLSVVLERFPRMVEETASALGKDVSLVISGDSVRVDGMVLSKLSDPLIHLVRNAMDHGIESASERKRRGKPERGTIRIECKTEGSRISVVISDDGAGLDFDAIRAKAMALWPENEAVIRRMDSGGLIRFLFRPGFSTKESASTLSGRGVGLDIVKVNIEAARGQVHLDSVQGKGCTFTLLLPVSASTMDGMFVLCSGKKYFIPASAINRTMLVDSASCFRVREKEMFNLEGVNIPLAELAVGLQAEQAERKSRHLPVLLIRGAAETIGIVVDRILAYDSLVYQPLPTGLRRNPLVQGIVFNTAFNIIPILNMWAVLDKLRSVRAMDTHRRYAAANQKKKATVLVVDDSVSTREIEISMLELEGYDVVGAVDGVDALKKIQGNAFDLVVSDLNMPRMDGLQLLENIRNDASLADLPVIIVTTVDEPETRRRADSLGVSRYLLKSSFDQDNLISAVRGLISKSGAET